MKTIPKSEPPKPHRLREDELFLQLYNSILTGLFSQFEIGPDGIPAAEYREGSSTRCQQLVQIAYQGACHAHAQLQFAEPYTDAEIKAFNQALGRNTDHN